MIVQTCDKIKRIFSWGAFSMPKYSEVQWQDYIISIKPIGIRKYFNFLPYLSGDTVKLKNPYKNEV